MASGVESRTGGTGHLGTNGQVAFGGTKLLQTEMSSDQNPDYVYTVFYFCTFLPVIRRLY